MRERRSQRIPAPALVYVAWAIALALGLAALLALVALNHERWLDWAAGYSVLLVVAGAMFLLYEAERRRRFIYWELRRALDLAAELHADLSSYPREYNSDPDSPPSRDLEQRAEMLRASADRGLSVLSNSEEILAQAGAYGAATEVGQARRDVQNHLAERLR